MTDARRDARQDGVVAVVLGLAVTLAVLVAISVANNSWRIWNTQAFCGSYEDFHEGPTYALCLSFPDYLLLAATHPPYVGPALLCGVVAGLAYVYRGRIGRGPGG